MSDLISSIQNGTINKTDASTNATTSSSNGELGKDAFLQLLVTQMKYQDPLDPSSDTEYIAQLATFSQLEQLQNLNATFSNSQAYGMVGKTVVVQSTNSLGTTTYDSGTVDYVNISNGGAQISVNGKLYSMSQVVEIYDDNYILSLGAPTAESVDLEYDHDNPKDLQIKVDFGTTSQATALAVVVNGTVLDANCMEYSNGVLTIKKEALETIGAGKYNVVLCFNDALSTTISDKVTITIRGEMPPAKEEESTEDSENSSDSEEEEKELNIV